MQDLLFLVADGWMVFAGFFCGWQLLRRHGNWLLGLEWVVVGTSGVNFLVWALLGADEDNGHATTVYFLDAFSRAVGITLILVLGLMRVTHGYKPSVAVEVGVFGLAAAAGLYLQQFGGYDLHVGPAAFFVVVNVLTTAFLAWFARRLWRAGARDHAVRTAVVTAAGLLVAVLYDFVSLPGDDEHHTLFAILALTTWGSQLWIYFHAYVALGERTARAPAASAAVRVAA